MKGIFLKQLCEDILAGEKKSWHEYSLLYPQLGYGEQLRSIWRQFKSTHASKGFWASGEEISAEDKLLVEETLNLIQVEPKGEKNEVVMSALNPDGTIMDIDQYCIAYNINRDHVKSYKLVTHNGKAPYYNIQSKDVSTAEVNNEILEAFDKVLERYKLGVKAFEKPAPSSNPKALKVTISDSHVGLDPNPKGVGGVFQYEYNADIYVQSMEKVYAAVLKEYNIHQQPFEVLLLDDLGDREDGWNGQTTRGGHTLPQNMTNAEVFDVIVDTNVRLVESLVDAKVANKIILRTVSNSNHSHDFALIVNKAIQKIVNRLYSQDIVEVDILEKFIEHRVWGDHCFLMTHGKNSDSMKHGLPLNLDAKTINFISDYLDHYDITSKYIHVEKGDLHQISYHKTRKFDYRNFMSFAPPSAWQQGNFGDAYAGFSVQVIEKYSSEISHTDYFIDYKKKK